MQIILPHPKGGPWTQREILILRQSYAAGVNTSSLSRLLGRTRGAIRNKAYSLGITVRDDNWSEAELAILRDGYAGDKKKGELKLDDLAARIGRPKTAVCTKARKLGLTDRARPSVRKPRQDKRKYKTDEDRKIAQSERMRRRHATRGHPMQGKRHTPEALEKVVAAARKWAAKETPDEKAERTRKAMQTKMARYGTRAPNVVRGSWKAGWREIGGKRNYYRSRWEANYARYLEWLKQRGEITDWQHEPETFWFNNIKRGVRSYLPDFRVWEIDGTSALHEVKGWMDARSKTTLKRMAKYHPHERIIVVREAAYSDIARKVGRMIDGWETSERADRW